MNKGSETQKIAAFYIIAPIHLMLYHSGETGYLQEALWQRRSWSKS